MRFKLLGLIPKGFINIKERVLLDEVTNYETHSLGGGEWSIEAVDTNGQCIKEFVGNNGTDDYEADNLWEQVSQWEKDPQGGQMVIQRAAKYKAYVAPDGFVGSYGFFTKEAMRGRLHGLVLTI
jgi:hypothetical protein